jgi:hypothetical protein
MKKLFRLFIAGTILCTSDAVLAQEKDSTDVSQELKKAGKATGKAVKKAGKKIGETGAKGAAKVKDKSLDNVKGPNGETVYIDENQRRYYINKDAKRVYITD